MNPKVVGKFIKELREEKGWSQEELANKIYVTRQAVSRWERGVGLPDYDLLLKICNVFNVTSNEIIAGERRSKKNEEYINNITIDVLKKNSKKTKKIIIIFSAIISLMIIAFLIYYFIMTYNQFKIYKISGSNDQFQIMDTLAVFSHEVAYLNFKGVTFSQNEPDEIEFYYLKNGTKKKIYASDKGDVLIIQDRGYDEYFSFDDIELMLDNMYADITYGIDQVDTIKLNASRMYTNNKLFFKNTVKISNNEPSNDSPQIDVPQKVKDNFILNDDKNQYILEYQENNKQFFIDYSTISNILVVEENENDTIEKYLWFLDSKTDYFIYYLRKENEIIQESEYKNDEVSCLKGDCSNHQQKYKYFKDKYIKEYFES